MSMSSERTATQPQADPESEHIGLFRLVFDQAAMTPRVEKWKYEGSGTAEDPYCVEWIPDDPRNPFHMSQAYKWTITLIQTVAFLSITFASSSISAADTQLEQDFGSSPTLTIAATSLFILAFAIGPVIWAPLSELYGRQIFFILTFAMCTFFCGLTLVSKNIATVLVMRFLAGAFGASAISNSGGVVSDLFVARDRGVGMLVFIGPAFLGPTIAPIACSYLAVASGWKWVMGLTTIFCFIGFVLGTIFIPETYHPVLLQRRAARLSKQTGLVYKSRLEIDNGKKTATAVFSKAMLRPWVLLFMEPIVLLVAIYMALIYGTLYMEFAAFPIVFVGARHWSQANSGLGFIGLGIGQILGMVYTVFDNKRYQRLVDRMNGKPVAAEARLIPSLSGAVLLPTGLFIFAWTNSPNIHWIACQIGTVLLGFSHVAIFLSAANYLVDTYTIYAASTLAANTVIRALVGAAFPLFANPMYARLGIHWGSSIPAFLALACAPVPILFYLYGPPIRARCKYAAESARLTEQIRVKSGEKKQASEKTEEAKDRDSKSSNEV